MSAPDAAFVRQYQDTIALLAQQMDTLLSPTVMIDRNWTGEKKFYDQYAANTFIEITSRYADTPIQDPDHRRRVVTPRYFVANVLEDPKDALQMLIDPKSIYMQANRAGANRKIDDIIISAFGGTAYTGQNGDSAQALTLQIAHGGLGMTKVKAIAAKKKLSQGQVEKEDRFLAHTEEQTEDLLNITEVTSSDYNVVKALVQGEVETWLGFKWVGTERLLDDGSSHRLCYAYQKKGIQLAIQKDPEGRVSERPDKNYAWQVYMRLCLGATRLEEARVVEISCAE